MQSAQALEEESKIEKEKSIKYSETAHIKLKWLHFQWNEPRELNKKNVQDLISCFQKDCHRLNIHNHIPAIIDQQDLDSALRVSGILKGVLLTNLQHEYPELDFWADYQLECLHRQHRIQVAQQVLSPSNRWWTVDLYLTGMMTSFFFTLADRKFRYQ